MTGALHLWSGFLFTSTVWAAMACALIDQQFRLAAGWAGVAAGLSACGVMHGYRLTAAGPVESFGWGAAGLAIPVCYALLALLFAGQGRARKVANAHG